jgi:hypothetical protein
MVGRFLSWVAIVFTRLTLGAAILLVLVLAILGEFEPGPAGLALLAIAAAIVLVHLGQRLWPYVWSAATRVKPRFGLRTLLLATLVSGVALAWIGYRVRDIRQQRQFLDRAFAHNFMVGFDSEMPWWLYKYFGWNGVLAWGQVGIVCKQETERITDDDLRSLDGLRYQDLRVSFSDLNDRQIRLWKPPKELRCFWAQATPLGDSTAEFLSQCGGLETIELWGTPITDQGVAHLARLPNLHTLGLESTPVTDGAVRHLKTMKQLKELRVPRTGITPQGVAVLRAALPECEIHY